MGTTRASVHKSWALFAPVANERPVPDSEKEIDILINTDVLSEGQNLQDCGIIINYDLTWNPIRLVQCNGRIDRIGSTHSEIAIFNMFPENELEALLRLVERLTTRICDHRRPGPARCQRTRRSRPSSDV